MTAFDQLLDRLDGVRRHGDTAMALCPGHDDRNPSLSLRAGAGKVLLYCDGGCNTGAVVDALGLTMADLYDQPWGSS